MVACSGVGSPAAIRPLPGGGDPPAGDQTITSRNFGIGLGALTNQTGGMVSRTDVYSDMRNYNFRILRVKYDWSVMEKADSTASVPSYDFSRIDLDFDDMIDTNALSGRDAHIIILLTMQDAAENPAEHHINDHVVPVDMQGNAAYGGGEWEYEKGNSPGEFGYRVLLENNATVARFLRFATALLEYLKARPTYYAIFEGIGVTESSTDGAQPPYVVNVNKVFTNVRGFLAALRPVIPTKMIYGAYNGPPSQLYTAYNFLPTIQGACWGPDVFPDQISYLVQDTTPPIDKKGHYVYYQERTDIVKFLDVQPQDYKWTANPYQIAKFPDVGHHPELQELYDFAVSLDCNYLIWYRDTAIDTLHGETLANYVRVRNWMNTNGSPQKTLAHGGMNTVAPPSYDP